MDYKKMMGYGDKKKIARENPKQKTNKILESVKEEFGYVNEGPAADYAPYLHSINQNYKKYWDSVKMLEKQLVKKGLKREAHNIHSFYTKFVTKFHKWFEKFVRKIL